MSDQDPIQPPSYPGGDASNTAGQAADGAKGFLGALFDLSFDTFVTPKVVKFVYPIAIGVIGLGYLVFLIAAFSDSAGFGIVVLILGPVVALLYLAFIRMMLEMYFAMVRMSEDIHHYVKRP